MILKLLEHYNIKPKRSYRRKVKQLLIKALRSSHAKHFKRAKQSLSKLCTCVGRLVRDVERKLQAYSQEIKQSFEWVLTTAGKLIKQAKRLVPPAERIYSLHEPAVACISKGKAHKRFEFGNKVSLVSVDRTNFIVGCVAHDGNPHDGHTLAEALTHVKTTTGYSLNNAVCAVDLGYRGHTVDKEEVEVVHPKLKKLSNKGKKLRRRRPKIEAIVSFAKRRCRMACNYLKGVLGNQLNALGAAAAYNLRLIARTLTAQT